MVKVPKHTALFDNEKLEIEGERDFNYNKCYKGNK